MNPLLSPRNLVVVLGLAATAVPVFAADDLDDDDQSGWFVRLGGRISSGVKAEVRNTRPLSVTSPGLSVYDDGFVGKDNGGSPTLTQNWGYQSASQVNGDTLTFRDASGMRVGDRTGLKDDPQFGGELVAGFEFVRFDIGRREARFGFEVGYSFSEFSVTDHATASGNSLYYDYALNGVIPPVAPYSGSPDQPGPLLTYDSPVIRTVPGTSSLDTKLESDFHTLRVGPWIEVPLSGRVNLALSVGYCTVYTSSQLTLTETDSLSGSSMNRYLSSHWSPGGYAQLRAIYRLTKHIGVYVGGDFQYNTGVTINAPGRQAKIDFGTTYGAVAGVNFGF
ncbi:MAG TPA: hypothetical protein VMB21_13135 [Candidatus Limnocylindria bacterium]|nr:hypothetical protein [Candidatus Limnocylindria bacterium]